MIRFIFGAVIRVRGRYLMSLQMLSPCVYM